MMKMTAEKIEQAREMRDEGMSCEKIGMALNVGASTIQYHLDAAYRQRRAAYRAKFAERTAAHRALITGVTVGATAAQVTEIAEVYRRAKEDPKVRCYLCGQLIPMGHRHVDHITPLSKGGKHRPSNLAVACDTCNLKKNAKTTEEMGILL